MFKIAIFLLAFSTTLLSAQDSLTFKTTFVLPSNPVESQGETGTCWSFSTASFLESELIRMNKGGHNLSELFVARQVYLNKADNFVRRHGKTQFGEGSLGHDLLNAIDEYGIVPNEVFNGLQSNSETHNHKELSSVLIAYLNAVIQNKGKTLTPHWKTGYERILDMYLGEYPESFSYRGKNYTPVSFANELEINSNDYITLSSYTHEKMYEPFILDVPDNWDNGLYFNVELQELLDQTIQALESGYTIEWDTDVSNEGFNAKKGIAICPIEGQDPDFNISTEEMNITADIRQMNFDNYAVTDDHLMHIVGISKGSDNKNYFVVKNSWGDKIGLDDYKGHVLVSYAYFKLNTISIMLHKDALSDSLKMKLNFSKRSNHN
jgi:bleomycin hydrolase